MKLTGMQLSPRQQLEAFQDGAIANLSYFCITSMYQMVYLAARSWGSRAVGREIGARKKGEVFFIMTLRR